MVGNQANINTVYAQVNEQVNKNQKGGYIPSDVFNRFAILSEQDWRNDAYSRYDGTQKNWDDLSLLRSEPYTLHVDSSGKAYYPSDYWHASEMWVATGNNNYVEIIGDYERASRLSSELLKPTDEFPVAVMQDTFIQLYPTDIGQVRLSYLRIPAKPYWNYTVSSNRKIFAESGGTDTNVNMGTALTNTDVDTSGNQITISGHGLQTGQAVFYTANGNTAISSLNENTKYFIIKVSSTVVALAQTYTDALNGTRVNLASQGTGTQYLAEAPNILSGDSTHFSVPSYATDDLVYRICAYMGIYLREGELYNASEQNKNTSNG